MNSKMHILFLGGLLTLVAGCDRTPHDNPAHSHADHSHSDDAHGGGLMCGEHGVLEADCGICRPEAVELLRPGESLKVRLPSTGSAELAGIRFAPVKQGWGGGEIECLAEIGYNENKIAKISSPVGGTIQEIMVETGTRVEQGQVVARVWSAAIAEAVARAVLTHQTLDRERRLRAQRVTAQKDLDEAEAAHRGACQQLRTLGFSEARIEELANKPEQSVLLELRAPFAGEVVDRSAVQGALIEPGKPLITVVDRSVMWAVLNIPETALTRIEPGLAVRLSVGSLGERTFRGILRWISPEIEPRTRMAQARAEVPNPNGALKARMFARAVVELGGEEASWIAPSGAVQFVDGIPMVFLKESPDLYLARRVRLGPRISEGWSILEGVNPGDEVAVAGAFPLKSQLLLSRLGAGCADD